MLNLILVAMKWWEITLTAVGCLIIGFIVGFFVMRKVFKTQLKKNPPINEKMIRAMFQQMGRPASEKQIKAVMRSMEEANK